MGLGALKGDGEEEAPTGAWVLVFPQSVAALVGVQPEGRAGVDGEGRPGLKEA